MRPLGLFATACCLLWGCAIVRNPVNGPAPIARVEDVPLSKRPLIVVEEEALDDEQVELPAHREKRETASTEVQLYEPEPRDDPRPKREVPGTARIGGAPIFVRSDISLDKYKIKQGTDRDSLESKQRIMEAMAITPELPADGAAVTVITRNGKAILFGTMQSAKQRQLVEDIASENAKRVESHLQLFK